jgi:hypothetical protein
MMTKQTTRNDYEDLVFLMRGEEGVRANDAGLFVHGKLFAFLMDDDLVVELPLNRMVSLESRGVAERFTSKIHPTRDWVRIADPELWPELATEAHQYVGEPAVGGES